MSNSSFLAQLDEINRQASLEQRFRGLATLYADRIGEMGVKARAYESEALPHFSKLDEKTKESTCSRLSQALEVFAEMDASGESIKETPQLLWRSLRQLKIRPRSDIFDKIEKGDIVCIYSPEQVQIFQNLAFFEWVSITLEHLYSGTWYQYSKRDEQAALGLYQAGLDVSSGKIRETFEPPVPEHLVEEVGTEHLLKFFIKVRYMSPVQFPNGGIGAMVINRCRKLA